MKEPTKLAIETHPERFGNKNFGFSILDDDGNGRIIGNLTVDFSVPQAEIDKMFEFLKAGKIKLDIR